VEKVTGEGQSVKSPSGAIHLRADESNLEILGTLSMRPIFMVLSFVPWLVLVASFAVNAKRLMSVQVLIACGCLAWALWLLNSSKRRTVLRLTREAVEVTEKFLFTERRMQAQLDTAPEPQLDAIRWEDEPENMLRLRTAGDSHLFILKRHTAEDLRWVSTAIERWFSGGPHDLALHLGQSPPEGSSR